MPAAAAAPAINKTGLNAIRAASATGPPRRAIRASPRFSYRPAAMGLCSKKYDFAANAEFFGNTPETPFPSLLAADFVQWGPPITWKTAPSMAFGMDSWCPEDQTRSINKLMAQISLKGVVSINCDSRRDDILFVTSRFSRVGAAGLDLST